jgi:hypothetical protein
LGLSIVKKFTDKMGGRISLESECGVGSTFRVHFPIISNDQISGVANQGTMPKEEVTTDSVQKHSILLIEDESDRS